MSCPCHACDKTCSVQEEKGDERKERILNAVFLIVGSLLLLSAFLLNYFDNPIYKEISWASFQIPGFLSSKSFISFLLYTVDYLFLSYTLLSNMVEEIRERNYINEFTLMLVATIGAYAICEFPEAVLVVLFSIVGEMLEDYATERSSKSIKKLVNDMPLFAHVVKEDGSIEDEDPETLAVGSVLEIRPGEKLAVDGVLVQGETSLDLSSINGESLPRDAKEGDSLYSGSINLSSVIRMKTTKAYEDSTLARILSLVEDEQGAKAKSERFITRFSKFYTPAIVLVAILVFLVGYGLSGFAWEGPNGGQEWLYRALSVLLTSCPCALVIAVPISFFAGIGSASKFGVLIKGSLPLENLSKCDDFFFDKTGTLTNGHFVLYNEVNKKSLVLAASLESKSTHPLGKAITEACKDSLLPVEGFLNVPGRGIEGTIDGKRYLIGGKSYLLANGVEDFQEEKTPYKVLYLGEKGGKKIAAFIVADEIKKDAKDSIAALKKEKVKKTVMLSGDDKAIARAVEKSIGLDDSQGDLLPEQKLAYLKDTMRTDTVAYVGDGINDSPSLLASNVGIAMGALGSDAAIEASDVVVMDDELAKVAEGRRLARHTMRNVTIGVGFAILVKVLIMIVIACGLAGDYAMILGTFSDTGIMAICVLYAMSLLFYKTKYVPRKKA